MAWYGTSSNSWKKRLDVAIDGTSATAGANDVSIVIPPTLDVFWDNIQADGFDIVVTDADGVTVLTHQRTGFTYASKALTIEIDNYDLPVSGVIGRVCIYFDSVTTVVGDPSGSFTPSSALTGKVIAEQPTVSYKLRQEQPGRTRPSIQLHKNAAERRSIWFNPWPLMQRASGTINDRPLYEEVSWVTFSVDASGSPVSAAFDEPRTRFQGGLVRATLQAGSSGTDYTGILTIGTTTPDDRTTSSQAAVRIFQQRLLIAVQDLSEA